jgi:hypothetical protein
MLLSVLRHHAFVHSTLCERKITPGRLKSFLCLLSIVDSHSLGSRADRPNKFHHTQLTLLPALVTIFGQHTKVSTA